MCNCAQGSSAGYPTTPSTVTTAGGGYPSSGVTGGYSSGGTYGGNSGSTGYSTIGSSGSSSPLDTAVQGSAGARRSLLLTRIFKSALKMGKEMLTLRSESSQVNIKQQYT